MTNNIDSLFSALGDPTRRAVVEHLAMGPMPVGALHAHHDMALPTFLRHLKVLETAGLVRSKKTGRVRTVHLEAVQMEKVHAWTAAQRKLWDTRVDQLQALAEIKKETLS